MFPYRNDGSPPRERSPYKNKDIPLKVLQLLSIIVLIGIVLYTVVGPNNWPIRMFGLC